MASTSGKLPLDPDHPAPVTQAVAEVDQRGRVRIPVRLSSVVGWMAATTGEIESLMILDEPGRIILLSWVDRASAVLIRRQGLIEEAKSSLPAAEELRLLEDRYHRIIIPKDRRPTLGELAILHLNLSLGVKSHVYVAKLLEQVQILSLDFRNKALVQAGPIFSELP